MDDTIVAVATARGEGGIGIVRLSGSEAVAIADRLFRSPGGRTIAATPPFQLVLGTVSTFPAGEEIDEAFAVRMPAGRSYTGEPTVEFQCHGGRAVLEAVLRASRGAGASEARPGEFTKRAFLNGRLDLTQAEAVADLIRAESEGARKLALRQLRGELGHEIRAIREWILDLVSHAEAIIDFGEEEGTADAFPLAKLHLVSTAVAELLGRERGGRGEREGINVVIAGRTNVGKSSIFNELANFKRSIVTPIPGTTRDYIEERVTLGGDVQVVLVDTAGIRDACDEAEAEGVRRSRVRIREADLLVIVLDGSGEMEEEDLSILSEFKDRAPLLVLSKSDLPARMELERLTSLAPGAKPLRVSSLTRDGIAALEDALTLRCQALKASGERAGAVPGVRHGEALKRAGEHLERALSVLQAAHPLFDLAAADLRRALDAVGEITGESASEEILDRIFGRFCIGK